MPNKKTKDTRPARARYWTQNILKKKKIRQLIKHNGMTPEQAEEYWLANRKRKK